jgi:hypothetical protein
VTLRGSKEPRTDRMKNCRSLGISLAVVVGSSLATETARADNGVREPESPHDAAIDPIRRHAPGIWGDRVQLAATYGYLFGVTSATRSSAGFDGGPSYGLAVDGRLPLGFLVEFSFTWLPTELTFSPPTGRSWDLSAMDVYYSQIGFQKELTTGQIRPFASLSIGATVFDPHRSSSNEWRFGSALAGGVKFIPSDHVGIRLQARLLSTFAGTDTLVSCDLVGCTPGLFQGGILQTEFTAGVFLAL